MSGELSHNDGSDSVFGDYFDPSEPSEDELIEFMTRGSVALTLSSDGVAISSRRGHVFSLPSRSKIDDIDKGDK